MSLDICLVRPRNKVPKERRAVDLLRDHGFEELARDIESRYDVSDEDVVFFSNITHNLNRMAEEAGIYDCTWRPDENGFDRAGQLIEPLQRGIAALEREPERFKRFTPKNGWGNYDDLLGFARTYLKQCIANPDAFVRAYR